MDGEKDNRTQNHMQHASSHSTVTKVQADECVAYIWSPFNHKNSSNNPKEVLSHMKSKD